MEIICFAYPQRLSLLLLLLPLAGVLVWGMWRKVKARKLLADDELACNLLGGWNAGGEVAICLMQWVAAGFLLVAWSGPQLCSGERLVKRDGIDIVYVLDVSNSMLARDGTPDRLGKAKQEMLRISRGIDRGRSGLVAFAGSAVVQCPLTNDRQAFETMLSIAFPDLVEEQGTNVSEALGVASKLLSVRSGSERAAGARIVLLVSDGEDHGEVFSGGIRKLKENDVQLVVIGVGGEEPVPIPFQDKAGDSGSFKRDAAGRPVLTSFRPALLKRLADEAGGTFLYGSEAEQVSDRVLETLGAIETDKHWVREPRYREEIYQYFVLISVVLLLGAGGLSAKFRVLSEKLC